MSDFAANPCAAYEELSGCVSVLKKATTPYLPEGSLVDSDFTVRDEMAQDDGSRCFQSIDENPMECKIG